MLRKRKKPLLSFTKNKLLHSITKGKSTYFYSNNGELSSSKSSNHSFTNGLRVRLSSLREHAQSPTIPSAILTRRSPNNKSPYSKTIGWRRNYILPVVCSMALLLVFGWMVNPFAQGGGEKAYATINEDLGNGSTISLAIMNNGSEVGDNGTVSTEVQSGQVSYISSSIKVTTNKISKYYVGVQSATNSSSLTGSSTGATITGVGSNVSTSSFGDNTWGYALTDNTTMSNENLTYSTLPSYSASTTPQYTSAQNPANGEHELKLTFAAKIRADKPADHYQTTALVSVAAEAEEVVSGFGGITKMQDMTSTVCSGVAVGTEGRLIDTRDNKVYWVGKLKDNNCWMTQNLDLDLYANGANRKLTSADSDVTSDWVSTTGASASWAGYDEETNEAKYYDPGEYAYTNPTNRLENGCGLLSGTACKTAGWELMPGASTDSAGSETTHYLAGNYYSWSAATAGQAASIPGAGESTQSICPKGWRLPLSGPNNNTMSKSFYNLLNGLTAAQATVSPYYLVYSGRVRGGMEFTSSAGYYWSSTAHNDTWAYYLYVGTTVSPSNEYPRYYGYSIRCVAR